MATPGPKPKYFSTEWSPELAYAVGLLVTDGSLSKDGRHIDLTSKDIEQLENFMDCTGICVKIGEKSSGRNDGSTYYRIQFGSRILYDFLISIGITPNKTKTVGKIKVPKQYFFDFLRGHHDGDGSFSSHWDLRWKNSFVYYLTFNSASKKHVLWLRRMINDYANISGNLHKSKNSSVYTLRYAKGEVLLLLRKIYHSKNVICLSRKRLKIEKALSIVGESL